jgi:hypothetical protein
MNIKHSGSGLRKSTVEVRPRHGTQTRGSRMGGSMDNSKPPVFNSSALKQASDHALKEAFAIRRALSNGRFTSTESSKEPFRKGAGQARIDKVK